MFVGYVTNCRYNLCLRAIDTQFTEICCHTAYTSNRKELATITQLLIYKMATNKFLNDMSVFSNMGVTI